jgi:hypothetical protein
MSIPDYQSLIWMIERRDSIAAQVATGFVQAERGELTDGDEALVVLRRRRAERLPA